MFRHLGAVLGIAIYAAVFDAHGGYASRAAFISGFGPAMIACAGLALAGVVAGLFLPRRRAPPAAVAWRGTTGGPGGAFNPRQTRDIDRTPSVRNMLGG